MNNKFLLKMITSNNRAFLDYLHNELDKNKGCTSTTFFNLDLTEAYRLIP